MLQISYVAPSLPHIKTNLNLVMLISQPYPIKPEKR